MGEALRLIPPGDTPPPRDAVGPWLNLLESMLKMPKGERDGVRDELESHLRERVRDLMLAGQSEAQAASQAIAELGDAASLARKYREATGHTRRRTIMHVAALAVAGTAVTLSGIAFFRPAACPPPGETGAARVEAGGAASLTAAELLRLAADVKGDRIELVPMLVEKAGAAQDTGSPAVLARVLELARAGQQDSAVRVNVFQPPENPAMEKAAATNIAVPDGVTWAALADLLKKDAEIRWDKFGQGGDRVVVSGEMSLARFIDLSNEANNASGESALSVRDRDGRLIVGPQEYFDRQEIVLATYDLSPLVSRHHAEKDTSDAVIEEAQGVITQLVFPDSWQANGGDLASIQRFDAKLFIKAPRRFHAHIKWVVDELLADAGRKHAAADTYKARTGVPVLRDVPLSSNMMSTEEDVASRIGKGDYVIRGTGEGSVQIIGPDGVMIANEFRVQSGAANSPNAGAARESHLIPLARTSANEVADVIRSALGANPDLLDSAKEVSILVDANRNALYLAGPEEGVAKVRSIVSLLDMPAPTGDTGESVSRTFKLEHARANPLRETIGRFFNVNPGFKECGVARVLEVDSSENTFRLTCTPRQLESVARVVQAIDVP